MRAAVFVDGENFRFSIVELFPDFNQADQLPKNAQWDLFFDSIVGRVRDNLERTRAYWYVVQYLDFYPSYLPSNSFTVDKIEAELKKYNKYYEKFSSFHSSKSVREKLDLLYERKRKMKNRFDGWTEIYNKISRKKKYIEFRRAGSITYNLFDRRFFTEKAVDVKLAVDLVTLLDNYDIAIIVSGDQDYVPAVQKIKDLGKSVVNVTFKKRNGDILPGGAKRLNQNTDDIITLDHSELEMFLFR